MPLYEYICQKCNWRVEVIQKVSDAPLKRCSKCRGKLEKAMSRTSFKLKGSGWYATDYPDKKPPAGKDKDEKAADKKPEKGDDRKPEKGDDKKPEKGDDKKPEKGDDKKPASAPKTTSSGDGD